MNVPEAFRRQGQACAALGSPFMGRLMPLLADRLATGAVAKTVLNWSGDPSPGADSVPLRLAGGLHALKIEGLALVDAYPPHNVDDDTLWSALEAAMHDHHQRLLDWLASPPQTNEVRRAAPLIAALSVIAERYEGPVELLELGCSGGLNLRADRFAVELPDARFGPDNAPVMLRPEWSGGSPREPLPQIVARGGVDLAPIDPASREGRLKLMAYLWPDQPERMQMTEAAISIARDVPAEISIGDAGEWLNEALRDPASDRVRVVFHTVAWQYFPDASQQRALNAMRRAKSPVVRLAMEADGGHGARLRLTHYPSGEEQDLGRADFHGRWVEWAQ